MLGTISQEAVAVRHYYIAERTIFSFVTTEYTDLTSYPFSLGCQGEIFINKIINSITQLFFLILSIKNQCIDNHNLLKTKIQNHGLSVPNQIK